MFRVLNRHGSDALVARVEIAAGGARQWRTVQTAYSYGSSHDPRVHFGLGDANKVESAMVYWPDGARERFGPFEASKHPRIFLTSASIFTLEPMGMGASKLHALIERK